MYPSTPYASHPNAEASGPYAYAYSARPTPLPPQPLQGNAPLRKGATKKKSPSLFFVVLIGFVVGAAAFTTMKLALPEARAAHAPTFVLPEPPPPATTNVATADPSSVPPILSAAPPAFTGAVATPAPATSTDKSDKAGSDKKDTKPRKRAKSKTAAPAPAAPVAVPVAVPHNPYEG